MVGRPAGGAPAHLVHGDDPELVPHVGSQRQQDRGLRPVDRSQLLPAARLLPVSLKFHNILWENSTGVSVTGRPRTGVKWQVRKDNPPASGG